MKPVACNYSKLGNSQDELRVQKGTFNEIIYIRLKIICLRPFSLLSRHFVVFQFFDFYT